MFNSREEYEFTMKLYEEYEEDKQKYLAYLEELEEESMNFQRLQMENELRRKKQIFEELFGEE